MGRGKGDLKKKRAQEVKLHSHVTKEPTWIVRAGIAMPASLQAGTKEHIGVPGLFGFSVQYSPGKSVEELVAAASFPHPVISVSTLVRLTNAAENAGYSIQVVRSPGRGYHATVVTPFPLPRDLAIALSEAFDRMPSPACSGDMV